MPISHVNNLQIENNVTGSKERPWEKYFKINKVQDKTSQIFDAGTKTFYGLASFT
jgi:hypothetical protein